MQRSPFDIAQDDQRHGCDMVDGHDVAILQFGFVIEEDRLREVKTEVGADELEDVGPFFFFFFFWIKGARLSMAI